MRFEYDKEANALYIYLRGKILQGGVACTVELAPGVYLDADRAGRILGVEFLDFADFGGFLEQNGGRVDIPRTSETWRHPNQSRSSLLPSPGRSILIGVSRPSAMRRMDGLRFPGTLRPRSAAPHR
jgi:uncharacterized protein YuzE